MDSKTFEASGVSRRRPWLSIGVVAAIALLGALFVFDPAQAAIFPPCPFHELTGWDCPGCGSTRAFHQLLHGHLVAAVRYNAMFVLSVPLAAWYSFRFWKRRQEKDRRPLIRPLWLWLYGSAWLIFGVLRDLPVPWLAWFAP